MNGGERSAAMWREQRLAHVRSYDSVRSHLLVALDHARHIDGSDIRHVTATDLQNTTVALVYAAGALCEAFLSLALDFEEPA